MRSTSSRVRSSFVSALLVATSFTIACRDVPDDHDAVVTVRGSDTMVILAQTWAESFMHAEPGQRVQVSGGGTGSGIAALITGTADIATASRHLEISEVEKLERDLGVRPIETAVAIDAIAIYVHSDNPIASISLPELQRVFRGHVQDWSELGLDLGPIILYSRENNSGTYAFFKERVLLEEDFAAEAQMLPGTAAVINAVSKDRGAIGYGGIGYGASVRLVPLRLQHGDIVTPDEDATLSGTYPLARPLMMVTAGPPKASAQRYIDWALDDEGQAIVARLGFFPLPAHGERTP